MPKSLGFSRLILINGGSFFINEKKNILQSLLVFPKKLSLKMSDKLIFFYFRNLGPQNSMPKVLKPEGKKNQEKTFI